MDKVINPETKKPILIGKGVYNKLISNGYIYDNVTNSLIKGSPNGSSPASPALTPSYGSSASTASTASTGSSGTTVNPKTNRTITIGGSVYKNLVKEGYHFDITSGRMIIGESGRVRDLCPLYVDDDYIGMQPESLNDEDMENLESLGIMSLSSMPDEVISIYNQLGNKQEQSKGEYFWIPIKLKFKNILAYGDDIYHNIDFIDGINVIYSPNMTGKTSIINMILFTITNDIKTNIIHNGKSEGVIELHIKHASNIYTITKKLKLINGAVDVVTTRSENCGDIKFSMGITNKYMFDLSDNERFAYFSQLCDFKTVQSQIKHTLNQYIQSLNTNKTILSQLVITNGDILKESIEKEYETVKRNELLKTELNNKVIDLVKSGTQLQIKKKTKVSVSFNSLTLDEIDTSIQNLNSELNTYSKMIILESKAFKDKSIVESMIESYKSLSSISFDINIDVEKRIKDLTSMLTNEGKDNREEIAILEHYLSDHIFDNKYKVHDPIEHPNEHLDIKELVSELKTFTCNMPIKEYEVIHYDMYHVRLKELQDLPQISLLPENILSHIFGLLKAYIKIPEQTSVVIPIEEYNKILDLEHINTGKENQCEINDLKCGRFNYLKSEINYYHQHLDLLKKQTTNYIRNIEIENELEKLKHQSEDDIQIRESINKFYKYIKIIDINKQLQTLETQKLNFNNEKEHAIIIKQLADINSEMLQFETEISKITTVISKSQQKIGSLETQINQNRINIERVSQLNIINEQLNHDILLYTECDRVFILLPQLTILNYLKQFVMHVNMILCKYTKYQLVAKLNKESINMHLVGSDGIILKYPSGFESIIIKIAMERAMHTIQTNVSTSNMLFIDDIFGCFDEIRINNVLPDLIHMIKEYYQSILILSCERLQIVADNEIKL